MSDVSNAPVPWALAKLFSGLAGLFGKDDPTASDVHVDVPMGGKRKKTPAADSITALKMDGPRALKPMDDAAAHTPFPHDVNALGNLRSDQVPRFFGALTDQDGLDDKTVPLSSLTAMQNRVDPTKVDAMRGDNAPSKPPLVVRMNGRNYLADGHHRATAAYLDGKDRMPVKFKDLSAIDNALKAAPGDDEFEMTANIAKVDEEQRLVFGIFSVAEANGAQVVDHEDDRISPAELEKAAYDHVLNARIAGDAHVRKGVGDLVESVVFTPEKVAAMKAALAETDITATIDVPATFWWGGYYVHDDAVWKAVREGDYVAFSIGGSAHRKKGVD